MGIWWKGRERVAGNQHFGENARSFVRSTFSGSLRRKEVDVSEYKQKNYIRLK